MAATLSTPASIVLLVLGGAALAALGITFARTVDELADRTGIGEALAGALLVGATTSLPGLITTTAAAVENQPDLAVSNGVGSIAVQTTFLALADLAFPTRRPRARRRVAPEPPPDDPARHPDRDRPGGDRFPGRDLALRPPGVDRPRAGVRLRRVPRPGDPRDADVASAADDRDRPRRPRRGRSPDHARRAVAALRPPGAGDRRRWLGHRHCRHLPGGVEPDLGGWVVRGTDHRRRHVHAETWSPAIAAVRIGSRSALAVGDIVGGNTFDILFIAVADRGLLAPAPCTTRSTVRPCS
ncbi:MAG: sodium/calcium exchanger protein [Acidimicrobiia bacterium]|nr:sodium/calcium exchanger protein [Acidimicrobiia bacterium]